MTRIRFGLTAAAACLFAAVTAHAATVAPTDTTVDLANLVSAGEGLVFAILSVLGTWAGNALLKDVRAWLGLQATTANTALLNGAISSALGWARHKLDSELQGMATLDVHNRLAAVVAQRVADEIPHVLHALGMSDNDVASKVLSQLGLSMGPIQTVESPAPAPEPAPAAATTPEDYAAQVVSLVQEAMAKLAAPATAAIISELTARVDPMPATATIGVVTATPAA